MADKAVYGQWTSAQLMSFISSGKPLHLAGVVKNFPDEQNELDVLIPIIFDQKVRVIPGRTVYTWEQNQRLNKAVTMDQGGGLASAAPNSVQTFAYTQNSSPDGVRTNVRVDELLLNPVTSEVAIVTNVTVGGVNNVTVEIRGISPTRRFITNGTTFPQGGTFISLGVARAEVSDSTLGYRIDWTPYQWGMAESRESDYITGRTAGTTWSWVAGDPSNDGIDGSPGLYINTQMMNMTNKVRAFANRQLVWMEPDQSFMNSTLNAGFDAVGMCGMIPAVQGRHMTHPGGIVLPHGGTLSVGMLDSLIRRFDALDLFCDEYIQFTDREFSLQWSDLIRATGGVFDAWEVLLTNDGEERGVNLDFQTITRAGIKFRSKYVPIFSNAAGLNMTGSLYRNFALGIPKKRYYDAIMGEALPAVEIIASGDPNSGYSRYMQKWVHGAPYLAGLTQKGGLAPAMPTQVGKDGKDEIRMEYLYEHGTVYRGLQNFYILQTT